MCPLVWGLSAKGGVGLGNVSPWVRVSAGGGLPQVMGEAGVGVRVRCVEPWPLRVVMCLLLGGPDVLDGVSLDWPMG